MEVQLRIHCEAVSQEALLSFLQDTADAWFLVRETDASRPHYQAYIKFVKRYSSLQAMRNKVKKIISSGYQGNKAYSLSEVRGDESQDAPIVVMICYLLKENELISSKGISKDVMTQAEARQVRIQSAVEKRKSRPTSIVAQIMETLPTRSVSDRELARYMLKYFISRKKLIPDQGLFRRYMYSIKINRDPNATVEYLRELFQYQDPSLDESAQDAEFFSQ